MMMRKLIMLSAFLTVNLPLWAQDTTAYEVQRLKINDLLAKRSAKFGQYDQSLNERTGIFGLQTKRDIRNSNEILRQIALTDNDIFRELKVLLEYKDLQVEQVRTTMNTNSESILNYRKTIKDLQTQHQKQEKTINELENSNTIAQLLVLLFGIGAAVLAYFLNKLHKKVKLQERTATR